MLRRIRNFYKKIFWSDEIYARRSGVKIGENCKIASRLFGSEPYLIELGNHVQVTQGVRFATHGAGWVFREKHPTFDTFGKISVGNNVYIGNNAMILPGVTIGNNVIVGAGSIVTKSVASGSIVGGNPAKVIGNVNDLKIRMLPYNVKAKGLHYNKKRELLLSLPENKFIRK